MPAIVSAVFVAAVVLSILYVTGLISINTALVAFATGAIGAAVGFTLGWLVTKK